MAIVDAEEVCGEAEGRAVEAVEARDGGRGVLHLRAAALDGHQPPERRGVEGEDAPAAAAGGEERGAQPWRLLADGRGEEGGRRLGAARGAGRISSRQRRLQAVVAGARGAGGHSRGGVRRRGHTTVGNAAGDACGGGGCDRPESGAAGWNRGRRGDRERRDKDTRRRGRGNAAVGARGGGEHSRGGVQWRGHAAAGRSQGRRGYRGSEVGKEMRARQGRRRSSFPSDSEGQSSESWGGSLHMKIQRSEFW